MVNELKKAKRTKKIVTTAKRVDNIYPTLSFSSFTASLKLADDLAHNKKVYVNMQSKEFIQHMEVRLPCTLTGERLPKIASYGWRSVCNNEMDRVLACGPTEDPLLHRGLISKAYMNDAYTVKPT